MKRIALLLMLCVLFICVVGCGNNGEQDYEYFQPNENIANDVVVNDQQKESENEKSKEIVLTTENIQDYLIFSISIEDVVKNRDPLGDYAGTGKIILKTAPIISGEFANLSVEVKLESSTAGWFDRVGTIRIPFDGRSETTYKINGSGYKNAGGILNSPRYNLTITSVSGTFLDN